VLDRRSRRKKSTGRSYNLESLYNSMPLTCLLPRSISEIVDWDNPICLLTSCKVKSRLLRAALSQPPTNSGESSVNVELIVDFKFSYNIFDFSEILILFNRLYMLYFAKSIGRATSRSMLSELSLVLPKRNPSCVRSSPSNRERSWRRLLTAHLCAGQN